MTQSAPRDSPRERLRSSILLAVLLHALAFVALELFLKLAPQRTEEYSGPMYVQLEELPAVQQARQAAPTAPAASTAGQASAPAAAASAVSSVAVARAVEPPLPTGPALRVESASAPPAAAAPASSGSPFRTEGTASPQAQPRPSGQGFQTPSQEPTLPPAGTEGASAVSPQGAPLRGVAPGESRPSSKVPLEAVDRALASGGSGQGAGAPAAASGAVSQAGKGELTREGISIEWEDPTRGREPTYTPRPVIPKWVSDAGDRLTVGIEFVLTPQGVLHSVKVMKSSGYSDVDSAVLDAVRRWKFRPGGQKDLVVNGRVSYLILPR